MRLVADIGGTNARIALSANGVLDHSTARRYSNADWDSFNAMLDAYCREQAITHLDDMVIAVAGPVAGARAKLTNRNWTIAADELRQSLACEAVHLMNDLTAMGYAVPRLQPHQCHIVSGDTIPRMTPSQSLVVGIGTGFNVSPVITVQQTTVCPPAEAGHVSLPSNISQALAAIGGTPADYPTVESLFSGRGLSTFCAHFTGGAITEGKTAIEAYGTPSGQEATDAINHYAQMMGLLLSELSLSYMPSQGIYLSGSVARAVAKTAPDALLRHLHKPSQFRPTSTPLVYTIEDDGAALLGCAQYLP